MKFLLRILPGKTRFSRILDGAICLILLAFALYYTILSLQQPETWYQAFWLGDVPETPTMQYSDTLFGIGTLYILVPCLYCFLRRYARYTTFLTTVAAIIIISIVTTQIAPILPSLAPGELLPNPDNTLIPALFLIFLLPTLSIFMRWALRWILNYNPTVTPPNPPLPLSPDANATTKSSR